VSTTTKIEWTDHTFNPWWGCARVSPACRFCYADGTATRWGHELWRRKGPRRMLSEANWRNPLKWNRAAEAVGQPAKVFCASMADVFEVHPVAEVNAQLDAARLRLWSLIEQTPWLIWQLLTKRPENVAALIPWTEEWPANVWLGTSVKTTSEQQSASRFCCVPTQRRCSCRVSRCWKTLISGLGSTANTQPLGGAWTG
jgi:protein gp37